MLSLPHMRPLAAYCVDLRNRWPEVPDFDPADGGVGAKLLFLAEKPGPKTSLAGGGSGFISRNNDDPTAEATWRFMNEALIPRGATVRWNVIPGWNGTIKVTSEELRAGVVELSRLVVLLPVLKGVVLVGRKAQRADPLLAALGLPTFHSPHPSPKNRALNPVAWASIPGIWAAAARAVGVSSGSEAGISPLFSGTEKLA